MGNSKTQICHGCLCGDRKIIVLDNFEKKQCFLDLIHDLSEVQHNTQIRLCWECDALVSRFVRFKKQAQNSYSLLQDYNDQSPHSYDEKRLKSYKLYNFDILPEKEKKYNTYEIISTENYNNEIKEELLEDDCTLEHSDSYSDDDNRMLIEICTKKKKNRVTSRKRKKKIKENNLDIKLEKEFYKEIELTQKEIVEDRRMLELKEEYVNALFKCDRCILSFPNGDDFKDHEAKKHDLNARYKCEICECTFMSEVSFKYHSLSHARRYECCVCAARTASKRAATAHYYNTHTTRSDVEYGFENKLCENGQKISPELDVSTKSDVAMFPCEFCDKTFRWKTSLRKHAETHRIETGQKRRPYCEPCRLSFTTTSNLKKHVKTSSKHQIQLKLRKLKESLPEEVTLEKQQACIDQIKSSVISARQTYPCGQCDKKFQWRGNLLRHLHSHAARANGELVCSPCNRTFSSIATYQQHMKISKKHVSENDFKYMCSDCGKRFANKTRLRDHVDWDHLNNYVHKCAICQKVFKSHTSLYLHKQVVHKKDHAEHLCDHCGKPFPNRAKLRSHIVALHTAGAPYACAACSARFSWHSCLSRHVRRVHNKRADKQD